MFSKFAVFNGFVSVQTKESARLFYKFAQKYFDGIRSNYRYFDYKMSIHQPDIVKIIVYCKIIRKRP